LDDVVDAGIVICASATPDVTTPRTAAAMNADRRNASDVLERVAGS
jgi:hypothetical protein